MDDVVVILVVVLAVLMGIFFVVDTKREAILGDNCEVSDISGLLKKKLIAINIVCFCSYWSSIAMMIYILFYSLKHLCR